MTGTVIFGNRSRGRRPRPIWLSTTTAMQTMSTMTGFLVAARVRNIDLDSSLRRHGHAADRLALAQHIDTAEHDLIRGGESTRHLDHVAARLADRDVALHHLVALHEPHEVLGSDRHEGGQRHNQRLPASGGD